MIILQGDKCPFYSGLHLMGWKVLGINYNDKGNASMYMGALPQIANWRNMDSSENPLFLDYSNILMIVWFFFPWNLGHKVTWV